MHKRDSETVLHTDNDKKVNLTCLFILSENSIVSRHVEY